MNDFKENMKERTSKVAMELIALCNELPPTITNSNVSKQLIRCASSVGANYRAVCRARSRADFIHKMHIVEEECDECMYWLDLMEELSEAQKSVVELMKMELNEILSIIVTGLKTSKKGL